MQFLLTQLLGAGQAGRSSASSPCLRSGHQGAISFSNGWLSLAYDDFGAGPPEVGVRVRIFNATQGVTLDQTIQFPVGRTVVKRLDSGDLTASFQFPPSGQSSTARPALSALVEFDD